MEPETILTKLRGWINEPPAHFLNEFEPLYKSILRKNIPACKCPDKIRDAVLELYAFINKHKNDMETIIKRTAKLRGGVVLYGIPNHAGVFNNTNLTDEIARAFLEKYPKRATWFETLPAPVEVEEPTKEPAKEPTPAAAEETNEEPAPAPRKRGRKPKK